MKYLYIISLITLFLSVILLGKKDNKKNIVISSVYTLNILYCLNILITFILSIFNIKSSFVILSIINIFISCSIFYFNYKKNNKIILSKHFLDFKELICLIIIISLSFMVGLVRFNNFNDISYETTDPAVHYNASLKYSESLELLDKINSHDEMYGNFDRMMPGFYVNCGLFIKIFDNIPSYKAYAIFDTFVLCLMAITFYITCISIKKVKKNNVICLVLTCLYFCAYCLNSYVFGFGYLCIGVLSTNLIVLTLNYIEETKNKDIRKMLYLLLLLFNFSLFFSYYYFVPVLYLAQGLFIVYKWLKKEKKFKEIFAIGMVTLILPFIIGICYFILPGLFETGETVMSTGLALEGYIYRDLWSNFILILPLTLYSIILDLKKKKVDINLFFTVIEIFFIGLTFVLGLKGRVSSYYHFKSYFILWIFIYIHIMKLINLNDFNVKSIFKVNVYFIVFILLVSFLKIENKIQEKNILFNNNIAAPGVVNIYWFNGYKISENNPILTKKELDVIEKSKEYYDVCKNNKDEFPVIGNYLQKLWYYSITDVVPVYDHIKKDLSKFYEDKFEYEKFLNDKESTCLIVFNRFNNVNNENYVEINNSDYKVLYENNDGSILRKY